MGLNIKYNYLLVFFGWPFISSWHCFAPGDVVDDRGRASHVGHRDAVCQRSVEEQLRRLVIDMQVLRGEVSAGVPHEAECFPASCAESLE